MAGFTDSLPVRIKKEKEKIKAFPTKKEKFEYIWEYYKLPFFVTLCIIFIIASLISSCVKNNYKIALSITYVNLSSVDVAEETHKLEDTVNTLLGVDGKAEKCVVNPYFIINPEVYSDDAMVSQTKITAMVSIREMDCYLCDEVFMNAYSNSDFFLRLDEALPDDLLKKVKDRLLYFKDPDGNDIATGIDLSGLPFMTDYLAVNKEKPIFSIVQNSPNIDNAFTFLEYVIDYR